MQMLCIIILLWWSLTDNALALQHNKINGIHRCKRTSFDFDPRRICRVSEARSFMLTATFSVKRPLISWFQPLAPAIFVIIYFRRSFMGGCDIIGWFNTLHMTSP